MTRERELNDGHSASRSRHTDIGNTTERDGKAAMSHGSLAGPVADAGLLPAGSCSRAWSMPLPTRPSAPAPWAWRQESGDGSGRGVEPAGGGACRLPPSSGRRASPAGGVEISGSVCHALAGALWIRLRPLDGYKLGVTRPAESRFILI